MKLSILKNIPQSFSTENSVNKLRLYNINDINIIDKNGFVVYLCERELRIQDNFAFQYAQDISKKYNFHLKIIYPEFRRFPSGKTDFINRNIFYFKRCIDDLNIENYTYKTEQDLIDCLKHINPSVIIVDFYPIKKRLWTKYFLCKIVEVDGHNIVPARYVSQKQEYSAATFRKKIYTDIFPFITEFPIISLSSNEAENVLHSFIKNKLDYYAEFKNNPVKDVTSGLSKYLNYGYISAQRVALEVVKSDSCEINKETFLEELIVRKELSDNFCLYNKHFDNLEGSYPWAKNSLLSHKNDIREYIYSIKDFEYGKTHDLLWNSAQQQLLKEGGIHGYLRMYWAKKIAEWSATPEQAIKTAIYLNDKYSYDAPSPNGYVGILWAIAGLHDRAFKDWEVTGKIRRMTFNSINKKVKLTDYINKWSS